MVLIIKMTLHVCKQNILYGSFKRLVPYRGSGGTVPLVPGDDLHDVVVGVGGQGVAPSVEPKGRPPGQPQVKRQVGRFLKVIKLVKITLIRMSPHWDESWICTGNKDQDPHLAIRSRILRLYEFAKFKTFSVSDIGAHPSVPTED